MDKILERHKLPKLTQEETENLNKPKTNKESAVKKLPMNKKFRNFHYSYCTFQLPKNKSISYKETESIVNKLPTKEKSISLSLYIYDRIYHFTVEFYQTFEEELTPIPFHLFPQYKEYFLTHSMRPVLC